MPLVIMEAVEKHYLSSEVPIAALRGVDLEIEEGEFVLIAGPSGCGKSTLLHLMGGIDEPSRGRIEVDGRALHELDDTALSRFRGETVGFVFQFHNLLPAFTASENVQIPMEFARVPRQQREDRAAELLEAVGLSTRSSQLPSRLSGGEQQRVAIARALANEPRLVLLDEPTGDLDRENSTRVMELLSGLHAEGTTFVMVTHDLSLTRYASRVLELDDGKIVSDHDQESMAAAAGS